MKPSANLPHRLQEDFLLDAVGDPGFYTVRYSAGVVTAYPPSRYPAGAIPWEAQRVRWLNVEVKPGFNGSGFVQTISSNTDPGIIWHRHFAKPDAPPTVTTYVSWEREHPAPAIGPTSETRRSSAADSCVLISRAKNEGPHLLEWIAYHKVLGFDHIVIASNGSSDGSDSLLVRLAEVGEIDFLPHRLAPGESPDNELINVLLEYAASLPHEWVAHFDIDEFLVLKKHANVAHFLSSFDDDTAGVAINWRIYGSGNLLEPDGRGCLERFTSCAPREWAGNRFIKSFGRRRMIAGHRGPHLFKFSGGRYVYPSGASCLRHDDRMRMEHEIAQLNHYVLRSRSEFHLKRTRGTGNANPKHRIGIDRYNRKFFELYDRNEEIDLSALLRISRVKREMAVMAATYGLEELITEIETRTNAELQRLKGMEIPE